MYVHSLLNLDINIYVFRFYSHCEDHEPTLLLIRTTDGDVSNTHIKGNNSRLHHIGAKLYLILYS